jgi:Tfp pilus assembly protein PilF
MKPVLPVALCVLTAALLLPALPAWAAPEPDPYASSRPSADPDYLAGEQAWKNKDWAALRARMGAVVQRDPGNANAWNYLGFAARQLGQLDQAFKDYDRALKLDPDHRGAHEYVGETYLLAGNVGKAEEHLNALDRLCRRSCAEYRDLKAAIEAWRRAHPA